MSDLDYDAAVDSVLRAPAAPKAPQGGPDLDYDGAVDTVLGAQSQAANRNIAAATRMAPEQAARVHTMAREAGLPAYAVEGNEALVFADLTARKNRDLMLKNPVLARAVANNSAFADIAFDDMQNAADVADAWEKSGFGGASRVARKAEDRRAEVLRAAPRGDATAVAPDYSLAAKAELLTKSARSGVEALKSATAGIASVVLGGVTEAELAALYKDDPEGLQRAREAPANFLNRIALREARKSSATMRDLPPGVQAGYGEMSYATLPSEKAAYMAPTKILADVVQSLPSTVALMVTSYFTRGAANKAEQQALAAGMAPEVARKAGVEAAIRAAQTVGGVGEGAQAFAQAKYAVQAQTEDMPVAAWDKSPLYNELRAAGYSDAAAKLATAAQAGQLAGAGGGMLTGAISVVGGRFLGKAIGEGGNVAARAGKGFLAEAGVEAPQSAGEQFFENVAKQQFLNKDQDLLEGVAEAALQGFFVGGASGALFSTMFGQAQADTDAANLNSLMDLVGKSAAKARDPVTYGEFMSGVTADTPLYVDANELQNVLAQNKIDPATIPTLAEQLAQPSVTGDVEIPAGALMTAFAGTPAQEQIVQHVRKDQSNLSAAQFADLPAQEAAMVRLAQDVAEKQKKNATFTTEAREIEDDYLKQLRSTPPAPGRATMSERDNRFEARVMSAFYTVAADLWGVTPKQIRDGWTSASGQKYSGWKPNILGTTDQAQPTTTLSQGFDHGNAMLNVGLDVGATDRAQKIDAEFVKAEIEKLGVQVLSAKEVQGEYEYEGKPVKELTYVPHLSRPLTEAEVNALAIATGQEAIGQYDNGTGNLWGPNAANWGAFNPEFFKDQVGTKLSDAQKELAQKKTKTPKITEIVKGQKLEQSTPLTAKQWADVRDIALEGLNDDEKTAWLQAEQEVLAGVEEANRNSDVLKEIAKTALDKMPVPRVSTVPLLAGRLKLKIEPTGNFRKDGTRKTRVPDVARALFNKFRNAKASVETPEGREIMARAMVHEALYALSQDGHAVGWYDRKVREAIMTFALVHPEVLTSPRHNLAFRLIAAITSNGQAVRDNFILANDIYNLWSKEQVFPTEFAFDESQTEEEVDEEETPPAEGFEGGGPRKPAMVAAFKKINVLVKELGWDAIESEMLQLRTVRDVEKEFGLKIGGENKDTVIPTAVGLGGPKIGNFFANLSGYFDSPTMDLWFIRTAGRMEGSLLETKPALVEHLDELLTLLPEDGEVKGQSVATLRKEIEKYKALDKEAQLDAETTLKTLKHVSTYARAQFSQFASPHPDTGETYWDKSGANVNARRLVKNLAAVRDAPSSGGERNNLRAVVTRAMDLLEKQGISLTAADLQAVLWYHEKNLYSKLGDISASAKPWDYASAARFSVGRELGLVDVGSRQRAEAVPPGQPAPGGPGGLGAVRGLGQEDQGGALAQAVRSAGAVAGPVVGIHYSKAPRTSLASSMFGTGMKAAEAERVAASNDPRIKQRIAFYVDTGKGITPESDVGSYPHVATLRNLYDADADALKIWRNSKGDMNVAESAVLDAGFDGYLTRNFGSTGAVVMLGQRSLDVEGISKADVATRAEQPPSPEIPKMKQASLAIMQNRALPFGQQSVESWKRDLERVDPDTAALIAWDKIPPGDYYKDQIAGQLWQDAPALFAEAAEEIRKGSFSPLTFELRFLEPADRSTFIHEASHFFMAAYIDMASQPDAPPQLKEFVENLLGYLFEKVPGGTQAGGEGLGQKVGAGGTAPRLAPNGKPSKLTERQWLQVRTPEFKAWFGDWEKHAKAANPVGSLWSDDSVSKIVDENGEPLVVYHGTQQGGFDVFRPEKGDKHRSPMLFATADAGTARSYSGRPSEIEVQSAATDVEARRVGKEWYAIDKGGDGSYAYNVYGDYVPIADAESYINKKEAEFFINTDLTAARQDSGDLQRGIYHLFLNIRDPNEVDFEGANWDGRLPEPIYELQKDGDYTGEYAYTLEDAERALKDGRADEYTEVTERFETTDSVAEEALRLGNDGAIIHNVVDDGGKHGYGVDPSDVFVFFNSNQVKSATQNDGAFSIKNDSILHQDGQPSTPGPLPEGRTNLERWSAMTLGQQRAYWEFFAEGFEQYAMTGKAPTKALQSAFNAFAKWMKEIYKSLKAFVMQHGTKPLDAELTQYFDRMLATDEELEAARAERGFQALFKNLAESGMSPAQFADYMALDDLQKTEAEELLRSRSIRDMKWLSNAKSKAIKELQAEADELRALVQAGVEEELAETPIRQAERWLKKGEMVQDGEQIKAQAGHRLDIAIVKAMFPEGAIAGQIDFAKLGRGKNALASSTGTQHPDDVAALFGFRNGEDLVRQLIDMPAFKDEVAHLTDLRMLEEHGDLATPEAIAKAADEAIHNDAHLRMVATEVWALNNRTGSVAALTKAAKAFAQNLVDNTVVKKLSPANFANAATRAGKAAVRAIAKKDTDKAATEKRTEMVNAAAAKAAYAAEAEVRAIVTRLRKISAYSDKHSSVTSREIGVVQAVRAILAEFDIGQHGEKATKYLKTLNEYDPTLGAVLDATIKQLAPVAKPWNQLKVAELRELREAVDGLWRAAKEVRTVELNGEKMDLDAARARLLAQLEKIPVKGRESKAFSLTDAEKRNQKFQSMIAKGVRPETLFAMMDGLDEYGEFRQLLWNTIDKAQLALNTEKVARMKQLKALLEPVMSDMADVKIDAPELGGTFGEGHVIGYSELLHAILHSGNESNLERLLVGRGWGSVREDGTLDTTRWDAFMKRMFAEKKITQKHMDFVQAVWDLLEELKPAAQAAHRATTGRYFPEIEAKEIVTPFGVYRGGYAPAIADRDLSVVVDMQTMLNDAQQDVMQTFEKPWAGFAKERTATAAGGRPLELNIAALGRHIDSVLVFSHMSVPIRNVQRVLKGDALAKALADYDKNAMAGVIAPWLHSAATQAVTDKGKFSVENNVIWTKLRSRAGMAMMFGHLANALQQTTGFLPAGTLVSKKEMLFAAAKGFYRPRELAASVAEMSPYMKQRLDDEVHALASELDEILLNPSKFESAQAWANQHAYFLQMGVDMAMSPIIWQAKFNQTMAEGKDSVKEPGDLEALQQKAVDLADSAVRMSQGSNRAIDVASIEKGSPLYRVALQFAGWANSQANLLGLKLAREKLMPKTAAKYGRITSYLAMIWIAPAIVAQAIAIGMRGGPDDDEGDGTLDEWFAELLMAPVKMAASAVPFIGPALMSGVNAFNDKPYDDRMSISPVVSLVEAAGRGTAAAVGALEDPAKAGRAIRDLGSFLSLFGVPVTPATKAIGYATDVETGKVDPTGPVDYGRGIITGTASPESKR